MLKTEVTVMYETADRMGSGLLDFLQERRPNEDMPQLYTLACVSVAIPMTTASVGGSFSASKRVQMYSRNATGQTGQTGQTLLSALASMSIGNSLLLELKGKDSEKSVLEERKKNGF